MRILVTGYKGFIASNMVKALEEHIVDTYEWGESYPNVSKYDWVIHMGAISSTTELDMSKIIKQNYESSVDLYNDCYKNGVNFQFSSSASVYGQGTEFKETSPTNPQSPYAWSKYMVESYIKLYPPKDMIAQCFRYFNVYGPGEDHKGNQASPFNQFKRQVEETGSIKLFENSDKYFRDFIHVDKVVEIHKKFFDVKESGIWNVGTGTTMSFKDVATQFSNNIIEIPMPDELKNSYQKYTCADMTKLKNCINNIIASP